MRVLFSSSARFDSDLSRLTETDTSTAAIVSEAVSGILSRIKIEGDSALLDITNSLEGNAFSEIDDLQVCIRDMEQAWERLGDNDRKALQVAANRITDFHQKQCQSSWSFLDDSGNLLGQRISPIDRVGVYVPGGKASYPSSVLMSVIPARVAGVSEVIAFTPSTSGTINDYVLAAFSLAGVDRVFMAGGAQAIGAMAFGTALVPKVDKIVGPGGAFVAEAKRQVFGSVGIDMIAGPSEVLVIADHQAPVEWVALDMFAQAEHDPAAQSIAIVFSENYAKHLEDTIERLIEEMPRKKIIKESLSNRGAIICCANRREAAEIANLIAPEHLGLMIDNPYELLDEIKNFGAVFFARRAKKNRGAVYFTRRAKKFSEIKANERRKEGKRREKKKGGKGGGRKKKKEKGKEGVSRPVTACRWASRAPQVHAAPICRRCPGAEGLTGGEPRVLVLFG